MIEGMSHVPPALIMLYQELAGKESWSDMRKTLKGMLKELRDQSEGYLYYQAEHGRDIDSHNNFEVHELLEEIMPELSPHGTYHRG